MEENNTINQTLLMKQILEGISVLKSTMPNGELKHLQDSVEGLRLDQKSLKEDLSEIRRKLLDPEGGVIVKVNENTKFRVQEESRYEDYLQFNMDLNDLRKWQGSINKAMWIIFTAIAAIALKVIFGVG